MLVDPLAALIEGPSRAALRLALAVPLSGPLGMTGPAALACAMLAAEEANESGGLRGRALELVTVDAGRAPDEVAADMRGLLAAGAVDAVCGFHTSDVHRALKAVTANRTPYVFTPPHEGGRPGQGVVLLGESPREQLAPVTAQLSARRALRRWALVGNDYIWPWAVHAAAVPMLRASGAEVVLDRLVPFGGVDAERLVSEVRRSGTQVVLLSLVGRDLATFNRAFARAGLTDRILRVSGALEENGLLEAGGDDSGELYAVMPWFASEADVDGFAQRYADRWGPTAPALGAYAHGCYQGVRHIAALAAADALNVRSLGTTAPGPTGRRNRAKLARADGLTLTVVH
ncbi:substrate-binding domain-containing protein [Catenulispora subtropica]|uniref:Substrate-binding domain-containing protein n=1 Tax=Catenulispora subtropica TaxID=450798 RepID=A0ABN2R2B5_9ACTN